MLFRQISNTVRIQLLDNFSFNTNLYRAIERGGKKYIYIILHIYIYIYTYSAPRTQQTDHFEQFAAAMT